MILNIPEQLAILQVSVLENSPMHFPPLFSTTTFDLRLTRTPPPHVLEQALAGPHSAHLQST